MTALLIVGETSVVEGAQKALASAARGCRVASGSPRQGDDIDDPYFVHFGEFLEAAKHDLGQ